MAFGHEIRGHVFKRYREPIVADGRRYLAVQAHVIFVERDNKISYLSSPLGSWRRGCDLSPHKALAL